VRRWGLKFTRKEISAHLQPLQVIQDLGEASSKLLQKNPCTVMTGNCTQREKDLKLAQLDSVSISKGYITLCTLNISADHFPRITTLRLISHLPGRDCFCYISPPYMTRNSTEASRVNILTRFYSPLSGKNPQNKTKKKKQVKVPGSNERRRNTGFEAHFVSGK